MSSFKLDDIVAAADKKYGSMTIDLDEKTSVELINTLRLDKETREELTALTDGDDEDADLSDMYANALRLVARKVKGVKAENQPVEKLIDRIGGDTAVLSEIFEEYVKGTQAGEASASES